MRRSAFVALALGAAAAFGLAGCSDSDYAESTAQYDGPPFPSAASADTKEGALAFADHYVATYNYARDSGDLNGLEPLEDSACFTCQAVRHDLASVYDYGGRIDGGDWKLTAPVAVGYSDGWVVSSPLKVAASVVTPVVGKPEKSPADKSQLILKISRTTGSWKVLVCDKDV